MNLRGEDVHYQDVAHGANATYNGDVETNYVELVVGHVVQALQVLVVERVHVHAIVEIQVFLNT